MGREPFARPGQRLEDAPEPREAHDEPAPPPGRPISIFGGVRFGPGYPSRWAGMQAMARLRVEDDTIVITPVAYWRLLRAPIVRIPLASIATANDWFGLRFDAPGNPSVDATRFQALFADRAPLRPLTDLLRSRGVAVERSLGPRQWTRFYRDISAGHRPGWFFRDRGPLAFVETFVFLGVGFVFFFVFTGGQHIALAVGAVFAAVSLAWSVAGHRRRQRATRKG